MYGNGVFVLWLSFFGLYDSELIGCDDSRFPVPARVAHVRCKRPRLLFAMARVSVQVPVPPVIATTSLAMAVALASLLARSEAVG